MAALSNMKADNDLDNDRKYNLFNQAEAALLDTQRIAALHRPPPDPEPGA